MMSRSSRIPSLMFAIVAAMTCGIAAAETPSPKHVVFDEVPLTSISPQGWLRTWLATQSAGLTGHTEVSGYPFTTKGWAARRVTDKPTNTTWSVYEPRAYWADGATKIGYLIGDQTLLAKVQEQTHWVLDNPMDDGILGPDNVYYIQWPHVPLFRALMAEYSATHDPKILDRLVKHYHAELQEGKLVPGEDRHNCNLEIMAWLYGLTGDKTLLDAGIALYNKTHHMEALTNDKRADMHGVTYAEKGKLPAIIYMYTGEKKYLDASVKGFHKLDGVHMLIDGCPSSAEGLVGDGSRAAHETCDITDFSWSFGYLLMTTGEVEWADKIERAVLNAGPGAVTKDFKAFQYYSSPNQVLCTHDSGYAMFDRNRFAYRPGHDVECCTGGVNRFMPNYAARMWMSAGGNGLAATLYGPSQVTHKVGDAQVTIIERTYYPFGDGIQFDVKTDKPAAFPLYLRIPGWCQGAKLTINGKAADVELKTGTFAKVDRTFADGDKLVLTLPMHVVVTPWPDHGLGVVRGPLVYSLAVAENRTIDPKDRRSTKEFPAYDMTPTAAWNYALDLPVGEVDKLVKVVQGKMSDKPYSDAPISIEVPARRVLNWELARQFDQKTGEDFLCTPALPLHPQLSEKAETITLVPLGCTTLRVTIFPSARP